VIEAWLEIRSFFLTLSFDGSQKSPFKITKFVLRRS